MTVTEDAPAGTSVIGQRRLRREDPALLTGEARFANDLPVPGALHLALVRSPYAHALITSIDTSPATALPGVVAVYTGPDLQDLWAGPMPCAWPVTDDMKNPPHYPLAVAKVCYAGDGVAAVVATSETAARDAVEAVAVEYEPLPAVIDLEEALADTTVIHDDLGTNTSYTWALKVEGEDGAVDKAFQAAVHTVDERFVQQRLLPMAMEPRAVVAVPQPFGGDITLYSATQVPHILKLMSAITLGLPEHQVRVVAPAVGGGFGSKLDVYAEELLCLALARRHKLPVRWNESRSENAQATIHGRGQIQHIELAADGDGKLTALRVRLIGDMGAYLQLVTPGIPLLGAFLYAGVYDLPAAYDFSCTSVFTTMTPTDAYRGAGRPEATYAIERAMDALAAKVGIDPLELRRRNFIARDRYPYTAWSGLEYDSGDHDAAATEAARLADYEGLRARQAEQNVEGATKRLGIGVSSYFEMCGLAPSRVLASLNYAAGGWEAATVRVLPTAKVQVVTGTAPHGQGHETAWSMIVAEKLGISPDDVDVLHSDTAIAPLGLDTYGSRSLPVGGVAIAMACDKVIDKAKQIAAHQLEASAADLEFAGGSFTVKGSPDKTMPLAAIAFEAFSAHDLPDGLEPNLECAVTYDPPNFSWPFGTHICVVEVDTETGAVEVLQYVAVDDCGVQINPMIVDGQVHGGIIQGLAQALFEEAVYDSDGNLKTSTLAEYLMPAASDVPALTLGHTVTPSPTNQLGVKGVGEAGTIGAAPAVINAVVDALSGLGVTDVPMPASPLNVWNAVNDAAAAAPGGAGVPSRAIAPESGGSPSRATRSDTAGTDVGDHPDATARTTVSAEEGDNS
jgi:carbon-monoxide dehydrogenase large subunit